MAPKVRELIARFTQEEEGETVVPKAPKDFDRFIQREQQRERIVQVARLKQQDPAPILEPHNRFRKWLRASQRTQRSSSMDTHGTDVSRGSSRLSMRNIIRSPFRKSAKNSDMETRTLSTRRPDSIQEAELGEYQESVGSSVMSSGSGSTSSLGSRQKDSYLSSTRPRQRGRAYRTSAQYPNARYHRTNPSDMISRRARPKPFESKNSFLKKLSRVSSFKTPTLFEKEQFTTSVSAPNPMFVSGKIEESSVYSEDTQSDEKTVIYDSTYESPESSVASEFSRRFRSISGDSVLGLDRDLLSGSFAFSQSLSSASRLLNDVDEVESVSSVDEVSPPPTPAPSPVNQVRKTPKETTNSSSKTSPTSHAKPRKHQFLNRRTTRPVSTSSIRSMTSIPPPPPLAEYSPDVERENSRRRKAVMNRSRTHEPDLRDIAEVNEEIYATQSSARNQGRTRIVKDFEMLKSALGKHSTSAPALLAEQAAQKPKSRRKMERQLTFERDMQKRKEELMRGMATFLVVSDVSRFPSRERASALVNKYSSNLHNLVSAMQHQYADMPKRWLKDAMELEIAEQT